MYDDYKKGRKETPLELKQQFPVAKEIAKAMGIPCFSHVARGYSEMHIIRVRITVICPFPKAMSVLSKYPIQVIKFRYMSRDVMAIMFVQYLLTNPIL